MLTGPRFDFKFLVLVDVILKITSYIVLTQCFSYI